MVDKNIKSYKNFITDEELNKINEFINIKQDDFKNRPYCNGNNVMHDIIFLKDKLNIDPDYKKIDSVIFNIINRIFNTKKIQDDYEYLFKKSQNMKFGDSGYEIRLINGPTREHVDGLQLGLKRNNNIISCRIMSCIMIISDCKDTIVFPKQNKKIKLKKGMVLLFPPY